MAEFKATKLDVSKINDGQKWEEGEAPSAATFNDPIEALLYLQDFVDNIGEKVNINIKAGEGKDSVVQVYTGEVDEIHYGNSSTGESAAIFGEANKNNANRALMAGKLNDNNGANSIVGGIWNSNNVFGTHSFVIGNHNQNEADSVIIGGAYNKATYNSRTSVVVGSYNETDASGSVTAGAYNKNLGSVNIVSGVRNEVKLGKESTIVCGRDNIIDVNDGAAFGYGLKVEGLDGKAVVGRYNAPKSSTIFEVGIGTSETDRRNGLEIYKDGSTNIKFDDYAKSEDIERDYAKKSDLEELSNNYEQKGSAATALIEAKEYADKIKTDILGEGVSETFDTLLEIQQWIEGDGVNATELSKEIETVNTKVTNIVNGTTVVGKATADSRGNDIAETYATKTEFQDVKSLANSKADANALAVVNTRVANIEEGKTEVPIAQKAKTDDVGNKFSDTYATKSELNAVKSTANAAATKSELSTALSNKVDKVDGKDLISTIEINRLKDVDNYDDTAIMGRMSTAEENIKVLLNSTSSFATKYELTKYSTTAEIEATYVTNTFASANYAKKVDVQEALSKKVDTSTMTAELDKKVDKVDGYSLLSNSEISRLAGVKNYDDTEIKDRIDTIEAKPFYGVEQIRINSWNEEIGAKQLAKTKTSLEEVKEEIESYNYAEKWYAENKATSAETNAKAYADEKLAEFAEGVELDYVTNASISETLADYAKTADVAKDYATKQDVATNFATKTELNNYATKQDVSINYATIDYVASTYATKTELSNYPTTQSLSTALANYATKSYVDTAVAGAGQDIYQHNIRFYYSKSGGETYDIVATVYTKSSTAFTVDTFNTWLLNNTTLKGGYLPVSGALKTSAGVIYNVFKMNYSDFEEISIYMANSSSVSTVWYISIYNGTFKDAVAEIT